MKSREFEPQISLSPVPSSHTYLSMIVIHIFLPPSCYHLVSQYIVPVSNSSIKYFHTCFCNTRVSLLFLSIQLSSLLTPYTPVAEDVELRQDELLELLHHLDLACGLYGTRTLVTHVADGVVSSYS